jgi:hypothetical protein
MSDIDRSFDWRSRHDPRSRNFPVTARLGAVARKTKRWRGPAQRLDQGAEGACVGFAWTIELLAAPVSAKLPAPRDAFARSLYREAQKIDEWPGECVDEATEVLTPEGWRGVDDLRIGSVILTFDIESETTAWTPIDKIHRYASAPYRVWKHRGFAAAVTDNHRWPVRTRPNGGPHPRPFRMTTTAEWEPSDEFIRAAPCTDLPTTAKWDDDLVELVAWVICEGSYRPDSRRGNGVVVSQKVHLDRCAALMDRLGVAPGHRKADGCHAWEISGELAAQVRAIAPGRAPRVDWLSTLTRRQLGLFLEVCVLADGNVTKQDGRKGRTSFAQKPGPILDSWLAANALYGQPVSRATRATNERSAETWTVRSSNSVEVRRLRPGPYVTGPVWCPQTEMGTFVARRDGSVFITGNSYEGTSVLAGAKIAQQRGYIERYWWAFGIDQVIDTLVGFGPVVIGIPWYDSMYTTRPDGLVEVGGRMVGGHAITLTGFERRGFGSPRRAREVVRWRNSWGLGYGLRGDGFIAVEDLERLLADRGEACVPDGRRWQP